MDITIMDRGGATVNKSKKILSIFLVMILILQLGACGFQETAKSAIDTAKTTAENAKGAVVQWYNGIDFSKFEAGWNAAVNWMGSAYSAAANSQFLQTEYIQNVSNTINELANNMNSAYGSHRGIAQEAGFAAEKWVAGTLNIDAAAKGSSDRAWAVNSHKLGSADVATSWGEEASLKYYGIINGYSLAKGEITPEDYGNLMADQVLITVIAMPVTAGLLTILPGTKLFVLAGCMAGGIIACGGYTLAKEATLEFVDGGGFEAIVPVGVANGMDQIKAKVANLNLSDHLTELKDLTVSTAENGYIKIKSVFD